MADGCTGIRVGERLERVRREGVRVRRSLVRVSLSSLAVATMLCIGLAPAVTGADGSEDAAGAGTLQGNGSVDEAWLTGAGPGDQITLFRHHSPVPGVADPSPADSLGTLIVRNLQPGPGYFWSDETTGQRTRSFAVLAPGENPPPDADLYTNQPMQDGLNYITMRDGIQLAATNSADARATQPDDVTVGCEGESNVDGQQVDAHSKARRLFATTIRAQPSRTHASRNQRSSGESPRSA